MSARRTAYASVAIALVAALPAVAAPAKKPPAKKPAPPRVVTITYSQVCSVSPAPTGGNGSFSNCPADQQFAVLKGEKFASVKVTDSSGRPAAVAFNVATTGVSDQLPTLICGSADRLAVTGGETYVANPTFNVGDTGCPTPPTSGTITITITRK